MHAYPYLTTSPMTSHAYFPCDDTPVALSEDVTALKFEAVTAAHAGALEVLFMSNSTPEVMAGFDPFPLTAARAREIAMKPRRDGYYVLAYGRRLLGLSMLRGADEGYKIPSFGVFIDHTSHRKGLGRMLTTRTLDEARSQGAQAVRLSVYESNLPARKLYESLGFVELERQVVDLDGETAEKIVMMLTLDS